MRLTTAGLLAFALAGCQMTQTSYNNHNIKEDTVVAEEELAIIDEPIIEPAPSLEDPVIEPGSSLVVLPESQDKEEPQQEIEAPITDLWQRIASQATIDIPIDNKQVQAQLNWYKKHPDYMKRISKRARPYLHWIVTEIEARDLPLELALLPIVESAYDPYAYSSGRAAGMWQIIPGTAKHLGLKRNWWYDGRRDVEASTDAALTYLTRLKKQFKGDWLHALAAYNSGEGRVGRAIKANKKSGKPTDFWSLRLPRETRHYVPKLLALSELLRNQDKYQLIFPEIPNEPYLKPVKIDSQIDLALAADLAGIDLKTMQRLNPGYNHWATAPDGPDSLLVPITHAQQFELGLASLPTSERLRWERHQVVPGDSLIRIAKMYQTTPEVIRNSNNIKGNLIRAGQHLLVPVAAQSSNSYVLSQSQRLSKKQSKVRGLQQIEHKVKPGDNLWDISRRYDVSHRELAKWNGMAPTDPLQIGQKLVVWLGGKGSDSITRSITYRVRNGDSLSTIAHRFGVRVSDLVKWNQLENTRYIQPGQQLKLFVSVTSA